MEQNGRSAEAIVGEEMVEEGDDRVGPLAKVHGPRL